MVRRRRIDSLSFLKAQASNRIYASFAFLAELRHSILVYVRPEILFASRLWLPICMPLHPPSHSNSSFPTVQCSSPKYQSRTYNHQATELVTEKPNAENETDKLPNVEYDGDRDC